jgi:hypothetical protein
VDRRATLLVLLVCGLAPAVLEHAVRATASLDPHHGGPLDRRLLPRERALLPGLRALFVQFWMVRIDGALKRNDRAGALRFAREALAIGPDLAVARARLSQVLAFDLSGNESSAQARVSWIGEALNILGEGIDRDPFAAPLHLARGIILWMRGESVPEFAAEFERRTGRTAFDAAADAMARAAQLAPLDHTTLFYASTVLAVRAEAALDRAKRVEDRALAGDVEARSEFASALASARDDYARVAQWSATQRALLDAPAEYTVTFAEHAAVSAELLALEAARLLEGGAADAERAAALRARRNALGEALDRAMRER